MLLSKISFIFFRYLKESGHPSYEDMDIDFNLYDEEANMEVETSESESDDENQESGELEEEENSIAKYQFKQSEATCLTDNAPPGD